MENIMKQVEFTCPKCGCHTLEEIMVDVTVASTIIDIAWCSEGIEYDYGEQTNEDGVIIRYQCVGCGFILKINDEYDSGEQIDVCSLEELAKWFKENS